MPERVIAYVDGFNLYHAINDLKQPHLKWLNLWNLCEEFCPNAPWDLVAVTYCSAFATWLPDPYKRHREYVKALVATGVEPVMGRFKDKEWRCFNCNNIVVRHEEKETDVNVALHLYRGAARNNYDTALLISNDSDIVPAVRSVLKDYPTKRVIIVFPPNTHHSSELTTTVGGKSNCKSIQRYQLEKHTFPKTLHSSAAGIISERPPEYDPPP